MMQVVFSVSIAAELLGAMWLVAPGGGLCLYFVAANCSQVTLHSPVAFSWKEGRI
jgi:hypothetical protein